MTPRLSRATPRKVTHLPRPSIFAAGARFPWRVSVRRLCLLRFYVGGSYLSHEHPPDAEPAVPDVDSPADCGAVHWFQCACDGKLLYVFVQGLHPVAACHGGANPAAFRTADTDPIPLRDFYGAS